MGIYKRCEHTGKDRDRCADPWYASYLVAGFPRARVALAKWTGRTIRTKTEAQAAFDELKVEVRAGRFSAAGLHLTRPATVENVEGPLTFRWLSCLFETHYVKGKQLKTAAQYPYVIKPLLAAFGDEPLTALTQTRLDTWYVERRAAARAQGRSQAWVNRPVSQLRTMLTWAVKRGYLQTAPDFEIDAEDYSRWRRVTPDEERRLLEVADPTLRALLILALDTGMRMGEMLALRVGDVDPAAGALRLRGATTKSSKTRDLPLLTQRVRDVLAWLQRGADGQPRPPMAPLILNAAGAPLRDFRYAWSVARLRAYGFTPCFSRDNVGLVPESRRQIASIDLHWHDLRHEFACRLDDRGVALGRIQRLLGHASIATTERYLRRGLRDLQEIRLDDSALPAFTPTGQRDVSQSGQPPVVKLFRPKTGTND